MSDFRLVGKIKEAHGLKGDVYVLIFANDTGWAPSLKQFALKSKEQTELQIYNVQRLKPFKKGLIIKAEEFQNRNDSEAVKGCEFYIPENLLKSADGETIFLSEIEGFMVKDLERNEIGPIVGFSSNVAQDLLIVRHRKNGSPSDSEKQVEIPFVDAFIKKIDFKNRYIVMDFPKDLLNLEDL